MNRGCCLSLVLPLPAVCAAANNTLALSPSWTEESWISRMAEASTIFRTMKRLMALSLGTSTPEASHLTRRTCMVCDGVRTAHQQRETHGRRGRHASCQHSELPKTYMAAPVLGAPIVSSLFTHGKKLS